MHLSPRFHVSGKFQHTFYTYRIVGEGRIAEQAPNYRRWRKVLMEIVTWRAVKRSIIVPAQSGGTLQSRIVHTQGEDGTGMGIDVLIYSRVPQRY